MQPSEQQGKDEVDHVEDVIVNKYAQRQADSFASVGGGPAGWRPTPVKDYVLTPEGTLRAVFDLPSGYKTVSPWSARHANADDSCELCGWAPLKNYYPIQNDGRKLLMFVGCECVQKFMGAGYYTKQEKVFMLNKTRDAFDAWIGGAINGLYCRGWLPREQWAFRTKLEKAKTESSTPSKKWTTRKILNAFEKAQGYGIKVPEGFVEPPKPKTPVEAVHQKHMFWEFGKGWRAVTATQEVRA